MRGMGPDLKRMGGMDGNLNGFSLCIREPKRVSFSPPQAENYELFELQLNGKTMIFIDLPRCFVSRMVGIEWGEWELSSNEWGEFPPFPPFKGGNEKL